MGWGNCALLEVQKTVRFKVLFSAQKFYLRTLAKIFSLRESSVFRSKVLLTNFRTFEKCESSEIELLAKKKFRSKVLFANFGQKIFAPRKFGFVPKSSICELWPTHFPSAKVRFCAQKFYSRTFALFKSAKVRKKNFWSKFFSYGSKFAKVRSFPPPIMSISSEGTKWWLLPPQGRFSPFRYRLSIHFLAKSWRRHQH